jgi:DNA invertase Pin-like site-specific DNA recombinase
MARKELVKAVAYFRTSSMTNVGEDKDTLKRQRDAVSAFAKRADYELIAEYSDDGVKGSDPVDQRPGFAAMLKHIASNGVRTIIVETANRFARDLITQETGWRFLRDAGITLIAADSPDAFLDDTPTAVMIRQILGSVAQFEKAMLVSKLRGARERRKVATGKCEGRKSLSESRPEVVALAKRLSRYPVNRRKRSLRDIAAELEAQGHVATTGKRYEATAIARMIAA